MLMSDDAETQLGDHPPAHTRPTHMGPGDAFGMRYRIIRQLGAGGMGVVYQAWDEVLGVAVAMKVIRRDSGITPAELAAVERRFKRELLLARQVTHKNVVRIHDLGDVEGTKYITMTYVDGEDLAAALKKAGTLPVQRVLRLARQIASGLEAAHDASVVHRDLKPANIMIDGDDNALIMDFGIALSAATKPIVPPAAGVLPPLPIPAIAHDDATVAAFAADGVTIGAAGDATVGPADGVTAPAALLFPPSGSGSRLVTEGNSAAGEIIGTLDYMSPEQSTGQPVDHHTDIYAFGLIITDLLLGKRVRPDGVTPWEALTARISQAPEPLTRRRPDIPAAFDAVITRCLQLDPRDRFATTHELVAALARLDDDGHLIPEPITKRFTPAMMAVAGVALTAIVGGTWWIARGNGPVEHQPVSVLIADFNNTSNDPVFTGLVEQALSVGVEGASFISAFPHRDAMRVVKEINAGPTLDDNAARLVAMREGLNVTIGGSISTKGDDYVIHVTATNVGDQKVLLDWNTTAAGKNDVLAAVGRAAERVRRTLGDTDTANAASEGETFTASSLEAAKAYSEAQDLNWAGDIDGAIAGYLKTLAIDPSFGRAHAGLAAIYANRGRTADAEASYQTALSLVDRMTEREKLRTRGGYYLFRKNYDKAIEEFSALLKKYPADTSGMANMALAEFYSRDMQQAVELGKRASDAYPNNVIRKSNAALFALYAGDFDSAEQLAKDTLIVNPVYTRAFYTRGMSELAKGHPETAIATFNQLGAIGTAAAKSFQASGLIDIALFQGRQQDALALLGPAIAADRAAGNQSSLGRRLALRANVLIARGDTAGALKDAREAVTLGKEESIVYPAGIAMIAAGQSALAIELAADLDNRLENEPRLYGALLRGEVALAAGRARAALNAFEDAQKLGDSWMGRMSLGRAYLALNAPTEAAAEFDRCLTRRGEATAVFLDDLPSYHVFAPVYYYLGRAQEATGNATAAESYKTFLSFKENGDERGLVADARRRVTLTR